MENTYEICYYGGMIAAIVLLIVTIVLFFVLRIPRVLGELTGITARKGVKSLKEKGTKTDNTSEREPKHYSQRTGAIKTRTAEAQSSELSKKDNTTSGLVRGKSKRKAFEDDNKTGFLGEDKITAAVTGDIAETAVLSRNDVEDKEYEFVETGKLTTESEEKETDVLTGVDNSEVAATFQKADSVEVQVVTGTEEEFTSSDDEATEVLSNADESTSGIGDDGPTEVLTAETAEAVDHDFENNEISEDEDEPTEVLAAEEDEATEVLTSSYDDDDEATAVLTSDEDATAVLTGDDTFGETSVLSAEVEKVTKKNYVVLYNVLEVHTSESL